MDYRFNMTPRLIAIAVIGFISLMVLLFALGFQFGQQWGAQEARQPAALTAPSQLNLQLPVTAVPPAPALSMPVSPPTPALPPLPPVGGAIPSPVVNPTVTLGRSN
jgi:hypothetical protein